MTNNVFSKVWNAAYETYAKDGKDALYSFMKRCVSEGLIDEDDVDVIIADVIETYEL
ncbi:MAG: hypothetical protein IKO36_12640 [Bacteroidaceae bacterium]|nr:hypothetical protein [Bacteroidaceae bacterium]